MLTGKEIINQMNDDKIIIQPFTVNNINPNSYNCTLNPTLGWYKNRVLDAKANNDLMFFDIPEEGHTLEPGIVYLGRTNERIATDYYIPCISGRSSLGRLGLGVEVTAGFGDIGFDGTFTLELTVVQPLKIYRNMEIAQIYFHKPEGPVDILYNGKYQHQEKPTASKMYMDKSLK